MSEQEDMFDDRPLEDPGPFPYGEDRKREVAKAIDTALTQHVADCPARNLKED